MAVTKAAPEGETAEIPQKRRRGRPVEAVPVDAGGGITTPGLMAVDVARLLERGIVLGTYPPGTRFVEEEVSSTFKVSRSPVREAFRRLEADGLVTREARRGVSVTLMSRADLDSVYSCRRELAGLAAEQAAQRITPVEHARLDQAFETLRLSYDSGSMEAYFDANIAFSALLHDISGNPTLIRILAGLTKQSMRYRFLTYRDYPEMLGFSLTMNRELIEAIKGGHSTTARDLACLLVQHSWDKIMDRLP
jgi:DNA-binding GntR family transcriptional regulator